MNIQLSKQEFQHYKDTANLGVSRFKFPNGEVGIKFTKKSERVHLYWDIQNSEDLVAFLLALDAIQGEGVYIESAFIPFLTYSQMDRRVNPGDPFSLEVFLKLIKTVVPTLNIMAFDIHGKVPGIDGLTYFNVLPYNHFLPNRTYDAIVAPDEGATHRAEAFKEILNLHVIQLIKVRTNGEVQEVRFKNDEDIRYLSGKHLLIVDDLCIGGATFIEAAKLLKLAPEYMPTSIDLVVTKGLFTKGYDVFKGHLDNVYHFDTETISYIKKEI